MSISSGTFSRLTTAGDAPRLCKLMLIAGADVQHATQVHHSGAYCTTTTRRSLEAIRLRLHGFGRTRCAYPAMAMRKFASPES